MTKLTLCPGRGEPSSARYSVFIGALRFCFTGDELGIETTTSQPLLRRLLCPREWKGKGTGCAVTTVGGWESSWVRPPPSFCCRDESGARLPEAHGPVEWALLCGFKDLYSAPCSLISPEQSGLPFLPCPSCFCSVLFYLPRLFFRAYFSFCFYTVITKLKGSCYECLWVLLASDWWADEGFLHRGVNVCLGKGTLEWA